MNAPTHNHDLLHFLQEIKPFASSWMAIYLHTSRLSTKNKSHETLQDACLFLNRQMHGHMARVFSTSNKDIVVLVQNIGLLKIERFEREIHHFFKDDPFIKELQLMLSKNEQVPHKKTFSTVFTLSHTFDKLHTLITHLPNYTSSHTTPEHIPLESAQTLPFDLLAKLQHILRQANLMNFMRKQSLCLWEKGSHLPEKLGFEYYLSMSDIESQASAYSQIVADFGLFKYLSVLFDKKMLKLSVPLINKVHSTLHAHINLNVRTVVSKEFFEFEKKIERPITVEIDRTDFLWNPEGVLFASDLLKSHGHSLCIDLITAQNLGLFYETDTIFDAYKIIMSDDLWGLKKNLFERFIQKVSAERIILTRCDDAAHIKQAQDIGVTQFQGFLIEHMLEKNTSTT